MESDDIEPSAWPHKSHGLRGSTGNNRTHAFLAWQKGIRGRVMGYRRAAEILASDMLSTGHHRDLDTVVFPFALCWRPGAITSSCS